MRFLFIFFFSVCSCRISRLKLSSNKLEIETDGNGTTIYLYSPTQLFYESSNFIVIDPEILWKLKLGNSEFFISLSDEIKLDIDKLLENRITDDTLHIAPIPTNQIDNRTIIFDEKYTINPLDLYRCDDDRLSSSKNCSEYESDYINFSLMNKDNLMFDDISVLTGNILLYLRNVQLEEKYFVSSVDFVVEKVENKNADFNIISYHPELEVHLKEMVREIRSPFNYWGRLFQQSTKWSKIPIVLLNEVNRLKNSIEFFYDTSIVGWSGNLTFKLEFRTQEPLTYDYCVEGDIKEINVIKLNDIINWDECFRIQINICAETYCTVDELRLKTEDFDVEITSAQVELPSSQSLSRCLSKQPFDSMSFVETYPSENEMNTCLMSYECVIDSSCRSRQQVFIEQLQRKHIDIKFETYVDNLIQPRTDNLKFVGDSIFIFYYTENKRKIFSYQLPFTSIDRVNKIVRVDDIQLKPTSDDDEHLLLVKCPTNFGELYSMEKILEIVKLTRDKSEYRKDIKEIEVLDYIRLSKNYDGKSDFPMVNHMEIGNYTNEWKIHRCTNDISQSNFFYISGDKNTCPNKIMYLNRISRENISLELFDKVSLVQLQYLYNTFLYINSTLVGHCYDMFDLSGKIFSMEMNSIERMNNIYITLSKGGKEMTDGLTMNRNDNVVPLTALFEELDEITNGKVVARCSFQNQMDAREWVSKNRLDVTDDVCEDFILRKSYINEIVIDQQSYVEVHLAIASLQLIVFDDNRIIHHEKNFDITKQLITIPIPELYRETQSSNLIAVVLLPISVEIEDISSIIENKMKFIDSFYFYVDFHRQQKSVELEAKLNPLFSTDNYVVYDRRYLNRPVGISRCSVQLAFSSDFTIKDSTPGAINLCIRDEDTVEFDIISCEGKIPNFDDIHNKIELSLKLAEKLSRSNDHTISYTSIVISLYTSEMFTLSIPTSMEESFKKMMENIATLNIDGENYCFQFVKVLNGQVEYKKINDVVTIWELYAPKKLEDQFMKLNRNIKSQSHHKFTINISIFELEDINMRSLNTSLQLLDWKVKYSDSMVFEEDETVKLLEPSQYTINDLFPVEMEDDGLIRLIILHTCSLVSEYGDILEKFCIHDQIFLTRCETMNCIKLEGWPHLGPKLHYLSPSNDMALVRCYSDNVEDSDAFDNYVIDRTLQLNRCQSINLRINEVIFSNSPNEIQLELALVDDDVKSSLQLHLFKRITIAVYDVSKNDRLTSLIYSLSINGKDNQDIYGTTIPIDNLHERRIVIILIDVSKEIVDWSVTRSPLNNVIPFWYENGQVIDAIHLNGHIKLGNKQLMLFDDNISLMTKLSSPIFRTEMTAQNELSISRCGDTDSISNKHFFLTKPTFTKYNQCPIDELLINKVHINLNLWNIRVQLYRPRADNDPEYFGFINIHLIFAQSSNLLRKIIHQESLHSYFGPSVRMRETYVIDSDIKEEFDTILLIKGHQTILLVEEIPSRVIDGIFFKTQRIETSNEMSIFFPNQLPLTINQPQSTSLSIYRCDYSERNRHRLTSFRMNENKLNFDTKEEDCTNFWVIPKINELSFYPTDIFIELIGTENSFIVDTTIVLLDDNSIYDSIEINGNFNENGFYLFRSERIKYLKEGAIALVETSSLRDNFQDEEIHGFLSTSNLAIYDLLFFRSFHLSAPFSQSVLALNYDKAIIYDLQPTSSPMSINRCPDRKYRINFPTPNQQNECLLEEMMMMKKTVELYPMKYELWDEKLQEQLKNLESDIISLIGRTIDTICQCSFGNDRLQILNMNISYDQVTLEMEVELNDTSVWEVFDEKSPVMMIDGIYFSLHHPVNTIMPLINEVYADPINDLSNAPISDYIELFIPTEFDDLSLDPSTTLVIFEWKHDEYMMVEEVTEYELIPVIERLRFQNYFMLSNIHNELFGADIGIKDLNELLDVEGIDIFSIIIHNCPSISNYTKLHRQLCIFDELIVDLSAERPPWMASKYPANGLSISRCLSFQLSDTESFVMTVPSPRNPNKCIPDDVVINEIGLEKDRCILNKFQKKKLNDYLFVELRLLEMGNPKPYYLPLEALSVGVYVFQKTDSFETIMPHDAYSFSSVKSDVSGGYITVINDHFLHIPLFEVDSYYVIVLTQARHYRVASTSLLDIIKSLTSTNTMFPDIKVIDLIIIGPELSNDDDKNPILHEITTIFPNLLLYTNDINNVLSECKLSIGRCSCCQPIDMSSFFLQLPSPDKENHCYLSDVLMEELFFDSTLNNLKLSMELFLAKETELTEFFVASKQLQIIIGKRKDENLSFQVFPITFIGSQQEEALTQIVNVELPGIGLMDIEMVLLYKGHWRPDYGIDNIAYKDTLGVIDGVWFLQSHENVSQLLTESTLKDLGIFKEDKPTILTESLTNHSIVRCALTYEDKFSLTNFFQLTPTLGEPKNCLHNGFHEGIHISRFNLLPKEKESIILHGNNNRFIGTFTFVMTSGIQIISLKHFDDEYLNENGYIEIPLDLPEKLFEKMRSGIFLILLKFSTEKLSFDELLAMRQENIVDLISFSKWPMNKDFDKLFKILSPELQTPIYFDYDSNGYEDGLAVSDCHRSHDDGDHWQHFREDLNLRFVVGPSSSSIEKNVCPSKKAEKKIIHVSTYGSLCSDYKNQSVRLQNIRRTIINEVVNKCSCSYTDDYFIISDIDCRTDARRLIELTFNVRYYYIDEITELGTCIDRTIDNTISGCLCWTSNSGVFQLGRLCTNDCLNEKTSTISTTTATSTIKSTKSMSETTTIFQIKPKSDDSWKIAFIVTIICFVMLACVTFFVYRKKKKYDLTKREVIPMYNFDS
ncbi:hypothetical protein SNEBB_009802 [Seison nebaliae]|nr:hypothetical protein SNEBB_009802 [Seison nebaliae]